MTHKHEPPQRPHPRRRQADPPIVSRDDGRGIAAMACARHVHTDITRRIPVALQLYSVRGDCTKDFDAALEQVAAMGFEGVEFAGYYGYAGKAADLKKRLDALTLQAAARTSAWTPSRVTR